MSPTGRCSRSAAVPTAISTPMSYSRSTRWRRTGSATLGPITTGQLRGAVGGSLNVGDIYANTVYLVAGADIIVQDVDAVTSASFTAGGLAEFLGIVSAPTIIFASGDSTIADGASLGVQGVTNVINLTAVSDSDVILGGGASAAAVPNALQYVLDEDGDIATDTLNINAHSGSGGGDPNIVVRDFEHPRRRWNPSRECCHRRRHYGRGPGRFHQRCCRRHAQPYRGLRPRPSPPTAAASR